MRPAFSMMESASLQINPMHTASRTYSVRKDLSHPPSKEMTVLPIKLMIVIIRYFIFHLLSKKEYKKGMVSRKYQPSPVVLIYTSLEECMKLNFMNLFISFFV